MFAHVQLAHDKSVLNGPASAPESTTRALRAHTPHAPCICIIVHMLSMTFTYTYEASLAESTCIMHRLIMVTVDGHGYDSRLNYTVCGACRPWHSILSILKPVFHQIGHSRCAYNSLRCLDLQILRFLCPRQRRHDQLLYPLRMCAE